MIFKKTSKISKLKEYQLDGKYYNLMDGNNVLFGEICKNCGYPNGNHYNRTDGCPDSHERRSLGEPVFFITELNKQIKIL